MGLEDAVKATFVMKAVVGAVICEKGLKCERREKVIMSSRFANTNNVLL